jgi:hypothetical protein
VSGSLRATGPLAYLGCLDVDPALLARRFAAGAALRRCDGTCCGAGVTVDLRERDRVLAHVDLVRRVMTPGQETDPMQWFAPGDRPDGDVPSGRATHTRVKATGCVFLDAERRCSLQKASQANGNGLDLKPFFCRAYPITVCKGELLIDSDADEHRRPQCCGATPGGPQTIFDVCGFELEHTLGPEGVVNLRRLAGDFNGGGRNGSLRPGRVRKDVAPANRGPDA